MATGRWLSGLAAFALVAAVVAVPPLRAQYEFEGNKPFEPDPAVGHTLAVKLCASCHIIAPDQDGVAQAGVPSFMAIAALPGRDETYLMQKMMHPFPPMIDLQLSTHEMRHLAAFIATLKP